MSASPPPAMAGCSVPADIDHTSNVDVRRAVTHDQYLDAFSLIYRCYRMQGYVPSHPGQIVYCQEYGLPTSVTLVARFPNGDVVGTQTIVEDSGHSLPMETEYASEISILRGRGIRLAEISGLAVTPQHRSHHLAIFTGLARYTLQYARWRGIDQLVIAVHPRKEPFYRRRFGFARFGSLRPYQSVGGHMAVACRLDIGRLEETMTERVFNSHFADAIPELEFQRPPMNSADHFAFCDRSGQPPRRASVDRKERLSA